MDFFYGKKVEKEKNEIVQECISDRYAITKSIILINVKIREKWSVRTQNWDLCLSQFKIMYEGRS